MIRGVIEQLVELVALSAALCIEEGNKNYALWYYNIRNLISKWLDE